VKMCTLPLLAGDVYACGLSVKLPSVYYLDHVSRDKPQ